MSVFNIRVYHHCSQVHMSFQKFYVYAIFPIPAILLVLLLAPLPRSIRRAVVSLCDSLLFVKPHPSINVSLFWMLFMFASFALYMAVNSMFEKKQVYYDVKHSGGHTSDALVKLLASERNVWITGTGWCLWVLLHRFRNLVKKTNSLEAQLEQASQDKKVN